MSIQLHLGWVFSVGANELASLPVSSPVQVFPWSRVLPAMPCPSKPARVGEPGRRRGWRPPAGVSQPARCLATVCFCSLTRALLQAWACPHRPCQGKACRGLPRNCTVRFMQGSASRQAPRRVSVGLLQHYVGGNDSRVQTKVLQFFL